MMPGMLWLLACTDPGGHTGTASPTVCDAPTTISVDGDAIPGETVTFSAPGATTWSTSLGDTAEGDTFAWTVPDTLAVDLAETVTVTATGCDADVSTDVVVDYPEGWRTVVVYNPDVDGSIDVAAAYQAFRDVQPGDLCPVSTTGDTEIGAEEFAGFVDTVLACVHPWTHAIVPVWGVPYRVSGQVADPYYGTSVSVSLDALLFYGEAATEQTTWDVNPVYQSSNSMTQRYSDWVPWGEVRRDEGTYYLVSRIEGVSADAAIALVDRTEAAVGSSLSGTVYVDGNEGDTPPTEDTSGSYQSGEWNMWGTRYWFEGLGWYPVVWDGNSEEFGTAPAPTDCPDALYYAGWYSYGNYNDCFTWTVGAIGGHLDSYSAGTPRGEGSWAGEALIDGITATFGAVNEPYVLGMPEYDAFYVNLTTGASFAEAGYEATKKGAWMMLWIGDPWYRPYPQETE